MNREQLLEFLIKELESLIPMLEEGDTLIVCIQKKGETCEARPFNPLSKQLLC